MGLTWAAWTSVSEGSTKPGAPVAAVPWGDSFALFIADPGGGIYAIKAVPGYGWEVVPGRNSTPGAHVTAVASGNRFTLFMADVNGEVFKTSGAPYQGWDTWTSVSEGSTKPGAPVAAVPWGDSFALFIADPGGSIYAIKAVPGYGWEVVPGRNSTPGAPVTAIWSGNRITLFMADVNGEIFTTSGIPYQGWDTWTSVSEGSTKPGAPVAAVPWGDSFALFIADPGGSIYAIKAVTGYGWEVVPGRNSTPGGQITAVLWYKPPASEQGWERFLLFMADVNGEIFTTSGKPYQGWDPWTSMSGIRSTPGAPVAALPRAPGLGPFALFIADSGGEIRETTTSDPPVTPENLRVTSVTAQTIDVSWTESNPASVELDGFLLYIAQLPGEGESITFPGAADRTASFTGLHSGVEYKIRIQAFNDNGYSPISTPVVATTPVAPPPPASLFADVQDLVQNGGIITALLIEGSNFGKSEQVLVTVDWTVDNETLVSRFPPITTNPLGWFTTTFSGSVPEVGLCPYDEPFGVPQPPQRFQVTATGLTSNKTASTTAGPFTCPFGP